MNCACTLLKGSPYIMPGWVCETCKIYNGLQRGACKQCGHTPTLPAYRIVERKTFTSMTGEKHTLVSEIEVL